MEEEIWKLIPGFTNYEASTFGRIRNNKTGCIRKLTPNIWGYLTVHIKRPDVDSRVELVHRMVALTFIPNPGNKPTVNHKKPVPTNNNVSNLEWADYTEQSNHSRKRKLTTEEASPLLTWGKRKIWKCDIKTGERIEMYETVRDASCALKSTGHGSSQIFTAAENHEITKSIPGCRQGRSDAMGFKWEFDDIRFFKTEEWRDVDLTYFEDAEGYQISTLGRICDRSKNVKSPYCKGYSHHTIIDKGVPAHRLVALTFIPRIKGKDVVNHIDGDKNNPVVDNLEWVTHAENIQHAYDIGLREPPPTKQILQYDLEGNFIKKFDSIKEANAECGIGLNLNHALKTKCVSGGFIWIENTGDIEQHVNMETYRHWSKRVKQYDMDGVFIREWTSMQAAHKEIPKLNVSASIQNVASGGFRWKLSNDNTPFSKKTMRDRLRKVNQYDNDMKFICQYESIKAAKTMYPGGDIHRAIKYSKTSKGFRWGYA